MMTTARPGARPWAGAEGRDVLGDGRPDLGRDRAAFEQPRAAGRRGRHAWSIGGTGSRGSPPPTISRVDDGEVLDLVEAAPGPSRSSRPRTSGSPTEGRFTKTLAAAPRAAASASSAATLRSLEAFTLLRPARASAAPTSSRQASTQVSGTSAACRAASLRAAVRAATCSLGVLGQLQRGREAGVGRRVVVGDDEEPVRELAAGRRRPRPRSSSWAA